MTTPDPAPPLPAGRELDALVAERVMKGAGGFRCPRCGSSDFRRNPETDIAWCKNENATCAWTGKYTDAPAGYSSEIADAWEVVEHMTALHRPFAPYKIAFSIDSAADEELWLAEFRIRLPKVDGSWDMKPVSRRSGAAPHAICLAALAAVEAMRKEGA